MSSLKQPSVAKSFAYICTKILNWLALVIVQITVAAVGSDKVTSCPEGSISQHSVITYSRHFGQLRVYVDCWVLQKEPSLTEVESSNNLGVEIQIFRNQFDEMSM